MPTTTTLPPRPPCTRNTPGGDGRLRAPPDGSPGLTVCSRPFQVNASRHPRCFQSPPYIRRLGQPGGKTVALRARNVHRHSRTPGRMM
ncbi:hypothetical protein C0Q70_21257 [Pomacea canaliculata]|uniref:Uncharacterized protein n=1 Tax=Pomacea canaliculata TaxID=400727 RepID=A0A2T7NBZ9_POMCA|nr:hypothetical protein C0Q70_21257 [Pomacea canaliculata]